MIFVWFVHFDKFKLRISASVLTATSSSNPKSPSQVMNVAAPRY